MFLFGLQHVNSMHLTSNILHTLVVIEIKQSSYLSLKLIEFQLAFCCYSDANVIGSMMIGIKAKGLRQSSTLPKCFKHGSYYDEKESALDAFQLFSIYGLYFGLI